MQQQLDELRATLAQVQNQLVEAEAELADRLAEINLFEFEFEARVGHLMDKLERLEAELARYQERIELTRNKQIFGQPYLSVETQYRRAWQAPPASAPTPPPQPLSPANEAQIRQLYRQLARRFHPDLVQDEVERVRRTELMAAINNAYAARSLAELVALAQQPDISPAAAGFYTGQTEAQLIEVLQAELARCRQRRREIEEELRSLSRRPSVELSLEVKLARRRGQNLLAEMAADLERKIARKTVERDILKAQFDQLGPELGFIPTER